MSDRRAPSASFFDRTKDFAHNLPHALSQPARSTAIMLFLFAAPDGTSIYTSVETLMDMTALSRSAQFRALKELMAAGYLREDGWQSYPNGVKTRRRRLDLEAMITAREAERVENHSPTDGTVLDGDRPTDGTLHSPTNCVSTVPQVGPKPSLKPPLLNRTEIPSGSGAAELPLGLPSKREVGQNKPTADDLIALWNTHCGNLPKVARINDTRRRLALKIFKEEFGSNLGEWTAFCQRAGISLFLAGENDRAWKLPNFEWLMRPAKIANALGGVYDNKPGQRPPPKPGEFVPAPGTA